MAQPKARSGKPDRRRVRFHPLYNDVKAGLALQAVESHRSDVLFALRRSVFVANSPVWDGMLDLPQPEDSDDDDSDEDQARLPGQNAPGVLPVIKVTDNVDGLVILLGCIHQHHVAKIVADIRSAADGHNVPKVVEALKLADKYDVTVAMEILFLALADQIRVHGLIASDAFTALAAAFVFKRRELAKEAFKAWRPAWIVRRVVNDDDDSSGDESMSDGEARHVASFCDVDEALFARLPVEAVHSVLKLEKRANERPLLTEQGWDDSVNSMLKKFFK